MKINKENVQSGIITLDANLTIKTTKPEYELLMAAYLNETMLKGALFDFGYNNTVLVTDYIVSIDRDDDICGIFTLKSVIDYET